MLIAHAPAVYVVLRLFNKYKKQNISYLKYGFIFSLWPDLDLLYFYLFDNRNTLHHFYFPHIPLFLLLSCCFIPVLKRFNITKRNLHLYYLFLINWFIHLILDTVSGGVSWLYPFSNKLLVLIKIPANYSHWIISFVLHWSFLIEMSIVMCGIILFFRKLRENRIMGEG